MSIPGVFVRFVLAYVLLSILLMVALSILGLQSSSGAAIAILIGATLYACIAYGKKNGVYFDDKEKIKIVIGFALINLIIKLLGTFTFLQSASIEITSTIIMLSLAEAGILHTIAIYFVVGRAGKQLLKQGVISA